MNKEEANRKAKAIFEKWQKEKDRIEKEAKANGIWNYTGLDTNNYLFKENKREVVAFIDTISLF